MYKQQKDYKYFRDKLSTCITFVHVNKIVVDIYLLADIVLELLCSIKHVRDIQRSLIYYNNSGCCFNMLFDYGYYDMSIMLHRDHIQYFIMPYVLIGKDKCHLDKYSYGRSYQLTHALHEYGARDAYTDYQMHRYRKSLGTVCKLLGYSW